MSLTQITYSLYLQILAIPMVLLLFLSGWKKTHILANARLCGLHPTSLFRLRFYHGACLDLLKLLHGNYGRPILSRPRDEGKLESLRSGPALFLSAHFHNWELMGSWLTLNSGIPLLSAALPLKHAASHTGLEWIRKRTGVPVIAKAITRTALRHLQSGKSFGMLWDQSPSRSDLTSPFFGHRVRMDPLPSFLALKSRAPVFFGAMLPGGRFRIVKILKAASSHPASLVTGSNPDPVASDLAQAAALRLARRYHRVLQVLVRAYPWCWYGLAHRRFKDQIDYG